MLLSLAYLGIAVAENHVMLLMDAMRFMIFDRSVEVGYLAL